MKFLHGGFYFVLLHTHTNRLLNSVGNRPESVLLGSVAVSFLLVLAADYLGASIELGCFLAGLAISSQGHAVVDQVFL